MSRRLSGLSAVEIEASVKNRRPRVVVVTSEQCWPQRTGGQARVAGLVEALALTSEVTLIGPPMDVPDGIRLHAVDVAFDRSALNYLSVKPRLGRSAFKRKVRDEIAYLLESERSDAVIFTHSYLAAVIDTKEIAALVGVDFQNVEVKRQWSIGAKRNSLLRVLPVVESLKARVWERQVCRRADEIFTVNEAEAHFISAWSKDVSVVPNATQVARSWVPSPKNGYVLYACSADYPPNTAAGKWLIDEVWPLVRNRIADAQLVIAGRNTDSVFGGYASEARGIRVLGEVDELSDTYVGCAVSVAPVTWGGGSQLKVVESLAQRRSVVATSYSVASVPVGFEAAVSSGDSAEQFAVEVCLLLTEIDDRHLIEAVSDENVDTLSWSKSAHPIVEFAARAKVEKMRKNLTDTAGPGLQ